MAAEVEEVEAVVADNFGELKVGAVVVLEEAEEEEEDTNLMVTIIEVGPVLKLDIIPTTNFRILPKNKCKD